MPKSTFYFMVDATAAWWSFQTIWTIISGDPACDDYLKIVLENNINPNENNMACNKEKDNSNHINNTVLFLLTYWICHKTSLRFLDKIF